MTIPKLTFGHVQRGVDHGDFDLLPVTIDGEAVFALERYRGEGPEAWWYLPDDESVLRAVGKEALSWSLGSTVAAAKRRVRDLYAACVPKLSFEPVFHAQGEDALLTVNVDGSMAFELERRGDVDHGAWWTIARSLMFEHQRAAADVLGGDVHRIFGCAPVDFGSTAVEAKRRVRDMYKAHLPELTLERGFRREDDIDLLDGYVDMDIAFELRRDWLRDYVPGRDSPWHFADVGAFIEICEQAHLICTNRRYKCEIGSGLARKAYRVAGRRVSDAKRRVRELYAEHMK